nr:hypothetical protein Iba_chr14aCG22450 [Ipomoea batatas]
MNILIFCVFNICYPNISPNLNKQVICLKCNLARYMIKVKMQIPPKVPVKHNPSRIKNFDLMYNNLLWSPSNNLHLNVNPQTFTFFCTLHEHVHI